MPDRDPYVIALCFEWIKKADDDLGLARHLIDERSIYLNAVAFHSQQACEKYLKALLVFYQQEYPKTHDIAVLLDILATVDINTAEQLSSADELNPYAVEARYPGNLPALDINAAASAVKIAETARDAIYRIINR